MDKYNNSHGRTYFPVLCNSADVIPRNHLVFNHSTFQGDYTYHKGDYTYHQGDYTYNQGDYTYHQGDYTYHKVDMKGQIDVALTGMNGRNFIKKLNIIQQNWFLSDHKTIQLILGVKMVLPAISLYRRALELNFDITIPPMTISRFKAKYDYTKIYLHTSCIIHFYFSFSNEIETFSGIRQGSASYLCFYL